MFYIDFDETFSTHHNVLFKSVINKSYYLKDDQLFEQILLRIIKRIKLQTPDNYIFSDYDIIKIVNFANQSMHQFNKLLDLDKYFYCIHKTFYSDLDISFKNDLFNLIYSDIRYPVDHMQLQKYGILSIADKKISDVTRLIETYKYIEDIDFIKVKRTEKNNYRKDIDYIPNDKLTTYYFTPQCFKRILLKSSNNIYINYFLLLEQIYNFYKDYIIQMQFYIIKNRGLTIKFAEINPFILNELKL